MRRSIALSEVKRKSFQEDRGKHLDDLEKHVRDHEMKEVLAEKDKLLQMKHDELEKVKQDKAELEKEAKEIRRKAEMQEKHIAENKELARRAQAAEELEAKKREKADCLQTLVEFRHLLKSKMAEIHFLKWIQKNIKISMNRALQQAWRRNMIRITLKLFTKPLLFLHILMMLITVIGSAGRR